jgi:hypothetical protein
MKEFQAFFQAGAGVAGALIGLLFVAIAVAPHKLSGERASLDFQIRAGLALNALIDAAVLSLFGLLPGNALGVAGLAAAAIGLSSTASLAFGGREHRLSRVAVPRIAPMLLLYVVQAVSSLALTASAGHAGWIKIEAILVVFCFLFAVDRAWELLGGSKSGLFDLFLRRVGHEMSEE